jgi:SAM-dependent methyltransferase
MSPRDGTDAPETAAKGTGGYIHGYGAGPVAAMAARTAEREAAFFLPHLRPGMRLLDAGCGPGSITLGMAAAVAPGEVVGLDLSPAMVEQARALATERGVPNVRFDVGDVLALPFPDAGFDAAFESAVLEHVPDPARAVRELRRVLRPGGVVGLRDGDLGSAGLPVLEPPDPLVAEVYALRGRLWRRTGGDPCVGRRHRGLLHAAGFVGAEAGATAQTTGTAAAARRAGEWNAQRFQAGGMLEETVALGWVDPARAEALAAACRAWGEHPGAFSASFWCTAVAWVPDAGAPGTTVAGAPAPPAAVPGTEQGLPVAGPTLKMTALAVQRVPARSGDGSLVNVTVKVEPGNRGVGGYDYRDFRLRSPAGAEHRPSAQSSSCPGALSNGTLGRGQWVVGDLYFEVPLDGAGYGLHYYPTGSADPRVAIGRWLGAA